MHMIRHQRLRNKLQVKNVQNFGEDDPHTISPKQEQFVVVNVEGSSDAYSTPMVTSCSTNERTSPILSGASPVTSIP